MQRYMASMNFGFSMTSIIIGNLENSHLHALGTQVLQTFFGENVSNGM